MMNYLQGRIFLGDAGAYTPGFLLAASLITFQNKHTDIFAGSILLIIFSPIADVAHSICRRLIKRLHSDRPDALHLHHVIMRSLVISSYGRISKQWANPIAMAIILPMAALPVALGVVYSKSAIVCGTLAFVFAVLIACTHFSIIKAARRQVLWCGDLRKTVLPKRTKFHFEIVFWQSLWCQNYNCRNHKFIFFRSLWFTIGENYKSSLSAY